ncbi:SEC10/PgrA surface exclusion-like protein [Lactobacillus colini]|uniref:SEC10/PgrA surface exclusion-like protein n=1 Tax=Lactobacillus colini TaxID=1819254 RepID=A0ABS4MFA8_9LACO|nr:SEC10/PgrA surface exclusion domain-containing protein [Lactobacillus colini]MBP2058021.1 SEC10/PgrA surface exclusion-like protein [Lactobacillus colini]
MNKKIFISALGTLALSGCFYSSTTQAASKTLTVIKKAPLYYANGKKTGKYLSVNKRVHYSLGKKIKIGEHNYDAYYIPSKKAWILKKYISLNKAKSKKVYQKASLALPNGYTRSELLTAFKGHPSAKFKKACIDGMNKNNFSRLANVSESKKDDKTKLKLDKLTNTQKRELANYTVKLINQVRSQLNLPAWQYSSSAQTLANDIANQYKLANWSIADQRGHYITGITKACKKNGFFGPLIEDNYVENMAGFLSNTNTITMTKLKKNIYFSLKQMIFGYAGSGEQGRSDTSKYVEWQHAASIFNTQGSKHDGSWDYFGFSISKKGKAYSLHFVCVPSFAVDLYHSGSWE